MKGRREEQWVRHFHEMHGWIHFHCRIGKQNKNKRECVLKWKLRGRLGGSGCSHFHAVHGQMHFHYKMGHERGRAQGKMGGTRSYNAWAEPLPLQYSRCVREIP